MFILLGWAERAGSGFPVIFQAWDQGKRRSPIIEEDLECDTIKVTLPLAASLDSKIEADIIHVVGAEFALLPELDKDILIETYQQGEVSNESLQLTRKDHARDIGARLKYLTDRGWLEDQGATRGRKYRFAGRANTGSLFDALPPGESSSPQGGEPILDRSGIESAILEMCKDKFLTFREISDALGGRSPKKLRDRYLAPMVGDGRLVRRYPDKLTHAKQAYRAARS